MTRIAICAPATPISRDVAERVTALARNEFPGLELRFHDQCFVAQGHFAGSDETRLAALLDCANDPAIETVWFAKGGYGTNRIAAAAIEGMGVDAREKTFFGYSDCGFLLGGLYAARLGRPVHGPMPVDIRRDQGDEAVRRALGWFAADRAGLEPSVGQTRTVAFNLMTLSSILGTSLMPDLTGHVVMIEEIAEHLYAVDRLLFHVTANLAPCGIAGLRLGSVSNVPDNDRPFGSEPEAMTRYWCDKHGIPYLGKADIGHCAENRIVPFGLVAEARPE
ncbi:LD-carboxypeptidase [Tsuneonella sp. HG249]